MPEQLLQQALALHRTGRLAEAEQIYGQALARDANFYPALHIMAILRLQQQRAGEALPYIERALTIRPEAGDMRTLQGVALEAMGRFAEALTAFDCVTLIQPGNSKVWSNRGAILSKLGRDAEALADLDRSVALDAGNADAWDYRAVLLIAASRFQDALESYDKVAALRPGDAGVLVNRGAVLRSLNRIDEALADYTGALARDPRLPEALASRSNLLWTRKDDLTGAIADLERLVAIAPDFPYAQGDLLHLKMQAGDWRDFAAQRAALDDGVRAGRRVAEPYVYQSLSGSPADLLACARTYAADKYPVRPSLFAGSRRPGKIRIGYVCGEFRAQATMYLAAGLFEHHDRSRFEVIGFDNSRDDRSAMRARVIKAFDKFLPIQTLSDKDAATLVVSEKIDILVNLNGYFGALRMGIFAYHPAPLQVNYLGFPGTLGADYIDYILADAEVIPPDEQQFFTDKVVTLPGSYQVNDDTHVPGGATSRAEHGLAEKDFVFCHFNFGYKILPDMFALWMGLLARVPDSVLWLLESNALFADNLKREAARHGIDPARLIFAPRLEQAAHLGRLSLGDLFLDSLPYNAHTTASDALRAGLPLLTCRGTAFAGRVASSLLQAVGMSELITDTPAEYEALAVRLALDRALLQRHRARLTANLADTPLFDTARTTRAIEAAYQEMMARWMRGGAAQSFAVPP